MSMTESDLRLKGFVEVAGGRFDRVKASSEPSAGSQSAENRQPDGKAAHSGKERDLHDAIIQECKNRGWICFHGSMAHRAHRTLGEPDFQILGNSGKFWLIEAKTQAGKLSVEQQGMVKWCEILGHKMHVVRSFEEFIETIQ